MEPLLSLCIVGGRRNFSANDELVCEYQIDAVDPADIQAVEAAGGRQRPGLVGQAFLPAERIEWQTRMSAPRVVTSNPFSTRFIRPGVIPFVFADGQSPETLVEQLRQHHWWGQIIGPHGS